MAKAIADPLILDVVELPESKQSGGTCVMWNGKPPEKCGELAKYVFVYDGKLGDDETKPKNCRACEDCVPTENADTDEQADDLGGGQ